MASASGEDSGGGCRDRFPGVNGQLTGGLVRNGRRRAIETVGDGDHRGLRLLRAQAQGGRKGELDKGLLDFGRSRWRSVASGDRKRVGAGRPRFGPRD